MAHSKISFWENPYFFTHTSVHWKRNYIGVLIVIRHSAKLTIWGLICSLTAEKNLRVYWIQHIIQSSLQTEGSHVNTHWRETVQMCWMREVIQSSLSSEDSSSQSHWGETLCVCTVLSGIDKSLNLNKFSLGFLSRAKEMNFHVFFLKGFSPINNHCMQ